jgi:hypothetical protein
MSAKSMSFVCAACLLSLASAFAQTETGLWGDLIRPSNAISQRASSADPDLNKNGDARRIDPGQTLVLGELEGPGLIDHIWCTVASDDPFYGRSLVLRMYWDGAEKPSVETPLGDFFGIGHAAMFTYSSMPVTVTSNGRAMNCFWRMPFRKSARLTVTNDSDKFACESFYYYVDWQKGAPLPDDALYFHAQYRQAFPAPPGDYALLETTGHGHYVGTVYSVHQMENGWFGEGDDRFYLDGEETPSIRGTGTEDYFCDAWGFRSFSTPYYGVPLFEGYYAGDRVTAYRWHLPDPVAFKKSLKVAIEHKGSVFTDAVNQLAGFQERADWISSVTFWYQTPPALLEGSLPPLAQRLPPYKVLDASALTVRAEPPLVLLKQDGILYMPSAPNASIEIDFEVPAKGRYTIQAIMLQAMLGGVYQPLLDGKAFGAPLDFCAEGMDPLWVHLDHHDLTEGKHTLRFEGRGASPKMRVMTKPVYGLGLRSIVLLRLEDMAGFQQTMKRLIEERTKQKQ